MMRWIWSIFAALTMAAAAHAAPCNGQAETKLKFSNGAVADAFVVEAFGATCADARVAIYLKTAEQGWHALQIGELSNFAGAEVSTATLAATLKRIAARIERPKAMRLESWPELQRAGTQPGGMPWRGTRLSRAEYERVLKLKPRFVLIPTDAARGMMLVWAVDDLGGRPLPYVYYGD